MLASNTRYIEAVVQYERELKKPTYDTSMSDKLDFFLEAYRHITGKSLLKGESRNSRFRMRQRRGRELADSRRLQRAWGRHFGVLGKGLASVGRSWPDTFRRVRARLNVIDPIKNELPFPDSSIRLILSDQTLEHVFDYRPVFAEQARVLEPGGVAIHSFPRGSCLIEPHTKIPPRPSPSSHPTWRFGRCWDEET